MNDLHEAADWGTDSYSRSDDTDLKATIRELKDQILTFEARLEALKAKERAFQEETRALIRAMNEYAERHSEDDRRLSCMVEQDTARSKEAKEEYDILQSRFDETKKGRSRTRMRQVAAKVFVYLSIVIPFVLMAPLYAIFWLIERLLNRLGWKKQKRPDVPYGRSSGRRRDRRSGSNAALLRVEASSSSVAEDKGGKKDEAASSDDATSKTGKTKAPRKRNVGKSEDGLQHTEETVETEESRYSSFSEACEVVESEGRKGDSDDVFVDARNGNEEMEARGYESENESESSSKLDVQSASSNDSQKKRPGWARLGESSESVGDLRTLPSSSALWDMSDDDMPSGMERHKTDGEASREEETQ